MERIGLARVTAYLFWFLFCLHRSDVCAQTPAGGNPGRQTAKEQAQQGTSQAKGESRAPPKKTAKKVWTNEDLGSLTGSVSTVGDASANAKKEKDEGNKDKSAPADDGKDAAWYRQSLASLRAQLESIRRQMDELKTFKANNQTPEGGIVYRGRYAIMPIEEQIKQLDAKQKAVERQIDDLESEARHKGIDLREPR